MTKYRDKTNGNIKHISVKKIRNKKKDFSNFLCRTACRKEKGIDVANKSNPFVLYYCIQNIIDHKGWK